MVHVDKHGRARLVLLAAILVLLVLGAVRPESYPLLRVAILAPGAFLLIAGALLVVPFLAMESAEGEEVRWSRVADALEHNTVLAICALMVLLAVIVVSFVHLATMTTPEKVVFYGASGVGLVVAVGEWLSDMKVSDHSTG